MSAEREDIPELRLVHASAPDAPIDSTSTRRSTRTRLGTIGKFLWNEHMDVVRERTEYGAQFRAHPVIKGLEYLADSAAEAIPGLGKVVIGAEALFGRTGDGRRLSIIERGLYIAALFDPFDIPGRVIVSGYAELDKALTPLYNGLLRRDQLTPTAPLFPAPDAGTGRRVVPPSAQSTVM